MKLLLLIVLLAGCAAPRSAQVIPSGGLPGDVETTPELSGEPRGTLVPVEPSGQPLGGVTDRSPAPHPTGGIGEPASYCKPSHCETPEPVAADGIVGWATYWNSFGPGLYAALRPDLGGRGDIAVVCGGKPWHCRSVNVITTCACGDRHGKPTLIDLSEDLFVEFGSLSEGLTWVSVQVAR